MVKKKKREKRLSGINRHKPKPSVSNGYTGEMTSSKIIWLAKQNAGFGMCRIYMITRRKMEKPRQKAHGLLPIHLSQTGEGRIMKEKKENLKGVGELLD